MNKYQIHPTTAKMFKFTIGGFFQGHSSAIFFRSASERFKIEEQLDINFERTYFPEKDSEMDWIQFINRLNDEVGINNWKKSYSSDILDGTQWSIEILMEDGTELEFYGSNSYPKSWGKFEKLIKEYFGKNFFKNKK
jgi:hypothetical protein